MGIAGPRLVAALGIALWIGLLAESAGQDPSSHESRIRQLEARLRDQDALLRRVAELEDRVQRYEETGVKLPEDALSELLETAVARMGDRPPVVAGRSQAVTFSGELRLKFEWRDPFDYRKPGTFGRPDTQSVGDDNDRVEQRTRLGFDARVTEDVRVFVQLQDSRVWGDELSVVAETNQVDLHQGFVDLENVLGAPVTVRAGRMELSYGDQRMISPLNWSNVGRAWDGVRIWWKGDTFQLDGLVTNIREEVGGVTDDDHMFGGVYFTYTGVEKHAVDAYILFRHFSDGSFVAEDGTSGDLEDWYAGVRLKGAACGFDYSFEGVYEFGDRSADDVEAFGLAATFGYTFDCECAPRLGLEWTYGTGDEDPADGERGTFDPPFPFGHSYQGFLDIFSWKNCHDFAFRFSVKPHADWQITLDVHGFLLDEEKDAWYGAAGTPIRRDITGDAGSFLGTEVDLAAKWSVRPNVSLWFGYTHLFAGDYIDDTGPAPDTDWVFAMLTAEF